MWMWCALVFVVGFVVAFQGPINQNLGARLGHPLWAALVSFCVGTLTVAAVALSQRPTPPGRAQLAGLPWWAWTGGAMGACFVVTAILAIPRVGAVGFSMLLVCGQTTAALLVDHYGWFGLPSIRITPVRGLGVAIMLLGFWLAQQTPSEV
ncbi:MAG: DMT family transporter [Planctomycetota bacterium]